MKGGKKRQGQAWLAGGRRQQVELGRVMGAGELTGGDGDCKEDVMIGGSRCGSNMRDEREMNERWHDGTGVRSELCRAGWGRTIAEERWR